MKNDEDYFELDVKIFISALPDTEKELKILLNQIKTFNKSKHSFRIDLVGNQYVMSTLKELELENKLNFEDMVKNKNHLTTLDTGSFTGDNVDLFIGLIWAQVEDPNYPETNLKHDFEVACKLEDEGLFDSGAIFYISYRKTSLLENADENELKKAETLKKYMYDNAVITEYDSLIDFKLISKECISIFEDSDAMDDIFTEVFNELGSEPSLKDDIKQYNKFVSILGHDNIEKFLEELEEQNQKEYGLFNDMFKYLEEIFEELNKLNDAFEKENKLTFDDLNFHVKNYDMDPKLITNLSKVFNKLSNEYEQDKDVNHEFRVKSLKMILSGFIANDQESEELLGFVVDCDNYFEELSKFIETYLDLFIEISNTILAYDDDDHEKSVNLLLKECDRILNNLTFIETELNDLIENFPNLLNKY